MAQSGEPQFSHHEVLVIIAGLMLGMLLAALDQTIVATALPAMAVDLGGASSLSWVVSAYLVTSTATTPIYGKLSDFYGRKRLLQTAIVIFVVTSILCALAGTMVQLIAFRALQGLGGGGLLAMAHATIADVVAPRERGRYQAYIGSTFAAASVAGPVLGGLFAEHLSWRWVFWINLPLGLAALGMAEATLRKLKVRRVRHQIDYLGAGLLVASVICILLVTTEVGRGASLLGAPMLVLSAVGLGLFALFVAQEFRAPEPILPPRLMANSVFSVASLISTLMSMIMLGGIVLMPVYLELVLGISAGGAGLHLIPLTVATVAGAITTGRRISITGRYKLYPMTGTVIVTLSYAMLTLGGAGFGPGAVAAIMVFMGLGIGSTLPVTLVAIQNAVDARDLGTATASVSFFRSLGGSFGVALLSALLIGRMNDLIAAAVGQEVLGSQPGASLLQAGAARLEGLSGSVRDGVVTAVAHAFTGVFGVATVIGVAAVVAVLGLRELPLRTTLAREGETSPLAAGAMEH